MSTRATYRNRLLVLAEALRAERDLPSDRQVALAMGLDPSYWRRIRENGDLPDTDQIDKVVEKLGIAFEFFADAALGAEPDYRRFIGTRLERDADARHPIIEQVIRERRASPEAAERLRAVPLRAFGGVPDQFTVASILAAIEDSIRREALGAPPESPAVPDGLRRVRAKR